VKSSLLVLAVALALVAAPAARCRS